MADEDRMSAEIRRLLEQWRVIATEDQSDAWARGFAAALTQCADELDALLAALAPPAHDWPGAVPPSNPWPRPDTLSVPAVPRLERLRRDLDLQADYEALRVACQAALDDALSSPRDIDAVVEILEDALRATDRRVRAEPRVVPK